MARERAEPLWLCRFVVCLSCRVPVANLTVNDRGESLARCGSSSRPINLDHNGASTSATASEASTATACIEAAASVEATASVIRSTKACHQTPTCPNLKECCKLEGENDRGWRRVLSQCGNG